MNTQSHDMEREIAKRIAEGPYASADDLVREALRALDDSRGAAQAWLEAELLKGLEGGEVEMTDAEWQAIEDDALRALKASEGR